jgi:hypothetical protein
MNRSLTLERPAAYNEERDDGFGFSIRIPPSWRESRRFSGNGTLLMQFTSPPWGGQERPDRARIADPDRGAHARRRRARRLLQGHARQAGRGLPAREPRPWQDGYLDVLSTETPIAESRVRRYYRVSGARGYSLTFEAREDVYPRVYQWCDMIAGTLRIGAEMQQKP